MSVTSKVAFAILYTIPMKLADLPHHHAVLLVHTKREAITLSLKEELQALSPVHRFFINTVLDIDTARSVISWAQTPYNGEKVALISFHSASIPAQNAMLKILEEPRVGVKFILVTSNKSNLIDTVLSRVHVITEGKAEGAQEDAYLFLETRPQMRMSLPYITNLLNQEDEEGRKNREGVRAFLLGLVTCMSKDQKTFSGAHIADTLEVASYAADPSSSGKALLEYISLALPQTTS